MAVVPDRRKDCTKRLEMLKTNKMITIDALTQLVEQHDGRASKQVDKNDSKEIPGAFCFSVPWVQVTKFKKYKSWKSSNCFELPSD